MHKSRGQSTFDSYRKRGPVRIWYMVWIFGPSFFSPIRGPDFLYGFCSRFFIWMSVRIFICPVRGTDFGTELIWSGSRHGFWSGKNLKLKSGSYRIKNCEKQSGFGSGIQKNNMRTRLKSVHSGNSTTVILVAFRFFSLEVEEAC